MFADLGSLQVTSGAIIDRAPVKPVLRPPFPQLNPPSQGCSIKTDSPMAGISFCRFARKKINFAELARLPDMSGFAASLRCCCFESSAALTLSENRANYDTRSFKGPEQAALLGRRHVTHFKSSDWLLQLFPSMADDHS
ncbi:hypothetical protein BaRGS_00030794 [Batillaria attramentaria]|uniref:Uncharacterized protein n=1 Tax=Batillaria attramentaria TaxID=370345 RepID=A0ABD0JS99_9CAEN